MTMSCSPSTAMTRFLRPATPVPGVKTFIFSNPLVSYKDSAPEMVNAYTVTEQT